MSVLAGQSLTADFTVVGSTGALVNGDSLPTGTLVINGTDNGATVTVTNKATGTYKAAVTVPATVAIGDVIQIRVNATVSTVASGGYIFTGTVDASVGQAGRTWYVATTGSDSNHGRSTGAPKLTISAAVTAASTGDTIDIGAGTFTEQISTGAKVLSFVGCGWNKTIITRSTSTSATVESPAPGCRFTGLKIIHTAATAATGAQGINAEYADDIEVRSCWLQGAIDGYTGHHSRNIRIYDSVVVGDWDGGGFEDCDGLHFENTTFQTTCEWSWNGSAYTADLPMHGLQATGSFVRLVNCQFLADRQHASSYYTAGLAPGQVTVIDGAYMNILAYDAGNTGIVAGIYSQGGVTVDLRSVQITVESAGTQNVYQIYGGSTDTYTDNSSSIGLSSVGNNPVFHRPATSQTGYTSTLATNIGTTNTRVDVASSTLATAAALTTVDDFLDTEVAAIKAKTDSLTFTVAGKVDANALKVGGQDATATAAVNFDTLMSQVGLISSGTISVLSHINDQDVTINQGETYSSTVNPLVFTYASGESWVSDLTGYTITLIANQIEGTDGTTPSSPASVSQGGSVVTATGSSRAVRIDATATQTAAFTPGLYDYHLQAVSGSTTQWLRQGQLRINDSNPNA